MQAGTPISVVITYQTPGAGLDPVPLVGIVIVWLVALAVGLVAFRQFRKERAQAILTGKPYDEDTHSGSNGLLLVAGLLIMAGAIWCYWANVDSVNQNREAAQIAALQQVGYANVEACPGNKAELSAFTACYLNGYQYRLVLSEVESSIAPEGVSAATVTQMDAGNPPTCPA